MSPVRQCADNPGVLRLQRVSILGSTGCVAMSAQYRTLSIWTRFSFPVVETIARSWSPAQSSRSGWWRTRTGL